MSKETWLPHYRSSSTKLSLGPRHGRAHFWSHIWTKLQWFIHKIGHDFHFISGIKSTLLLNFVSKSGKCPGIPLEISRFKKYSRNLSFSARISAEFPSFSVPEFAFLNSAENGNSVMFQFHFPFGRRSAEERKMEKRKTKSLAHLCLAKHRKGPFQYLNIGFTRNRHGIQPGYEIGIQHGISARNTAQNFSYKSSP